MQFFIGDAMTYKCPSDGAALQPEDGNHWCPDCGMFWTSTGNGRLSPVDTRQRPDDVRTDGELARARMELD